LGIFKADHGHLDYYSYCAVAIVVLEVVLFVVFTILLFLNVAASRGQ
jgi:hypothetical protein